MYIDLTLEVVQFNLLNGQKRFLPADTGITRNKLRQFVRNGLRFLDVRFPEYRQVLKVQKLDIGDDLLCVLGQIGAHIENHRAKYGMEEEQYDYISPFLMAKCYFNLDHRRTQNFGMFIPSYTNANNHTDFLLTVYELLTDQWLRELRRSSDFETVVNNLIEREQN